MSRSACKSETPMSTREKEGYIDAHQIVAESGIRSHSQIHDIDLHGKNITRISNLDQFCRVRTLDLSCNAITRIEGLHSCTNLKELKLYSNKISRIEELDKLKQLCHLTLQHNRIETIGSGLQSLQKLKLLRLDYNCLTRVSHHEFTGCPQLTHLDLSNNFLETAEGLDSLVQLEEIRLSNNKLTAMPVLLHCKKLEEIKLSGNPLSVVPKLNSHHSLKRLLLERTGITCLKALGQLTRLQELHVAHNTMIHLEGVADLFPCLEILDVRHNQLDSWESIFDVRQLKHLIELNMAGNPITCTESSDQSYHDRLAEICQSVEMVDEVQVKKGGLHTEHRPPVMRPMSAARALSTRQVQEQIVHMERELESVQRDLESRLTALTTSWDLLSKPSPETERPVTASRSASRCSSRSRILEAKAFADEHFNKLS